MRYLEQFDNLPTKLPMSDKTRSKLLLELENLPKANRVTVSGEAARQQRLRDIEALLQADLQCRKQLSSR